MVSILKLNESKISNLSGILCQFSKLLSFNFELEIVQKIKA